VSQVGTSTPRPGLLGWGLTLGSNLLASREVAVQNAAGAFVRRENADVAAGIPRT
jgi:hypothetical protein